MSYRLVQPWSKRQAHKDPCSCGNIMRRFPMNGVDGWLCGDGCGAFRRAEPVSEWRAPSRFEMRATVPAVKDPYGRPDFGILVKGKPVAKRDFAPCVQISIATSGQLFSQEFTCTSH